MCYQGRLPVLGSQVDGLPFWALPVAGMQGTVLITEGEGGALAWRAGTPSCAEYQWQAKEWVVGLCVHMPFGY